MLVAGGGGGGNGKIVEENFSHGSPLEPADDEDVQL